MSFENPGFVNPAEQKNTQPQKPKEENKIEEIEDAPEGLESIESEYLGEEADQEKPDGFNDELYEKHSAQRQEEGRTEKVEIDDVAKENLEAQGKSPEEAFSEFEKDVEALPEAEKKEIKKGMRNFGFFMEKFKCEKMAKGLEFCASKLDQKGVTARFLNVAAERYWKDTENAQEKIELAEGGAEGGNKLQMQNYWSGIKNVLGIAGIASGKKLMMSGSVFAKGAEVFKEAHQKSEKVIEDNRMDLQEAEEAAWKIYSEVQEKSETGNVSAEELEKTFQKGIPEGVLKRLEKGEKEGFASGFMERFAKRYLEFSAKKMDAKIKKVENSELPDAEKKQDILALLAKYKKQMQFADLAVSNAGKIDMIAIGARMAELGGKGAMVISGAELLKDAWDKLPDFVEDSHAGGPVIGGKAANKFQEKMEEGISVSGVAPKSAESFLEDLSVTNPNLENVSVGSYLTSLEEGSKQKQILLRAMTKAGMPKINESLMDYLQKAISKGVKFSPDDLKELSRIAKI